MPGGPEILTGITANEADALAALVSEDRLVLEVGSAYGFSALTMAAKGAHVFTIDSHAGVNPDSLAVLCENISASGMGHRVFPLVGESQWLLPALAATGAQFDVVFVDGGEHETGHDVNWGWHMLHRHGWLARHDYGEDRSPGVKAALDQRFPDGPDRLTRTMWMKRKP